MLGLVVELVKLGRKTFFVYVAYCFVLQVLDKHVHMTSFGHAECWAKLPEASHLEVE